MAGSNTINTEKLDEVIKSYSKLPKDKTIFIMDRTIIESWIEENSNSNWTRVLIDLLAYLKRRGKGMTNYVAIVPVDVLLEMKSAGKKYVENDTFKDIVCSLFIILEANPQKDLSGEEAVKIIANAHLEKNYTPVIVSWNKNNYSGLACHCLTPADIFYLLIMFYGLLPEPAQKVYSTWFDNLK